MYEKLTKCSNFTSLPEEYFSEFWGATGFLDFYKVVQLRNCFSWYEYVACCCEFSVVYVCQNL